jgi:hypothetical protein
MVLKMEQRLGRSGAEVEQRWSKKWRYRSEVKLGDSL